MSRRLDEIEKKLKVTDYIPDQQIRKILYFTLKYLNEIKKNLTEI